MTFILTALMIEAAPIIKKYKLKRDMKLNEFQVFRNDEIALVVTGVGKIKAAMGVVYIFSKYGIGKKDILLNIGLCGTNTDLPLGSVVIANKVTDVDTNRDYYPDLFIKGYTLKTLKCFSHVVSKEKVEENNILVDMESAGIMEAAYKFIYVHQIVICKIVSDYLTKDKQDILFIESIINKNLTYVDDIIKQCKEVISSVDEIDMENEEGYINKLKCNLNLTDAMVDILKNKVRKAKIKELDTIGILDKYLKETCTSKAERKRIFDELSKELS